jgi:hypothetical protein
MGEGWMLNSRGNWVWVDHTGARATVYEGTDGMWGAIWNGANDQKPRRLKGKFECPEEARFAVEAADRQGELSDRWYPPDDEWQESKKGGYHRRLNGAVVAVKQARSGSWYAVRMDGSRLGEHGAPSWFNTAAEACRAVNAFAARRGNYSWIVRQ